MKNTEQRAKEGIKKERERTRLFGSFAGLEAHLYI
jgi:hypothetical protein